MTPPAIYTLVKDLIILAALGFVIFKLIDYGEDRVKKQDLAAVSKQIDANAAQVTAWTRQRESADAQAKSDMADISARIGAQRAPIIVRVPAGASTVPGIAATSVCPTPEGGGSDNGSGVDIRASINAFELKYEGALTQCRAVLAAWPTSIH